MYFAKRTLTNPRYTRFPTPDAVADKGASWSVPAGSKLVGANFHRRNLAGGKVPAGAARLASKRRPRRTHSSPWIEEMVPGKGSAAGSGGRCRWRWGGGAGVAGEHGRVEGKMLVPSSCVEEDPRRGAVSGGARWRCCTAATVLDGWLAVLDRR